MKVLWISEFPPDVGGVGDYSYHLANTLAERGVEIDIVSLSGGTREEIARANPLHENVQIVGSVPSSVGGWNRVFNREYDVLNFHYPGIPLKKLTLATMVTGPASPALSTVHEPPMSLPFLPFLNLFDGYVFLSDHARQVFNDNNRLLTWMSDRQTFKLPYFGIDPDIKKRVSRQEFQTTERDDRYTLVCPGFIEHRKRYKLVVESMATVQETYPETELILAGGPSTDEHTEYFRKVEAEIERRNLTDRIEITGKLPEDHINAYMQAADLCVLPYKDKFQSSVLVKCIALGTTPVVAPIPGLLEVTDRYGGIVLEDVTAHGIAQAIVDALEDPPKVDARSLSKDLSWASNAERAEDVFETALARTSDRRR